jgi:hypothetical protein
MPLSWNEIKDRALKFSKEWEGDTSETAEAKSFWDSFFSVFGVIRRRVASFEEHVKKLDGREGYIDLFWPATIMVEHKSRGKSLDLAYAQAIDYFPGIKEGDLPRYILVSDFARFRLYDLESKEQHEFPIGEFYKNVRLFGFMAGYQKHALKPEDPANIKAAELMGKLHDQMKAGGYEGHTLEVYLVRLLFCMFAEDTSIFDPTQFKEYIEVKTAEDGHDLGHHLTSFFQVLNTPEDKRHKNLDEHLAAFPYVNGRLFEEALPFASFDANMRRTLLNCCGLDWSRISPAIFGSLFQSIMNDKERRNLGAHYTTEQNILKLVRPLFLDDLRAEFVRIKNNRTKLVEFHTRLSKLKFLDPACGCGNFLVITYRELRLLELEILRELHKDKSGFLDVEKIVWLDVDQFYGIEIEDFPAQIAQVALWMTDHQMNMRISEEFGQYFRRLPLKKSPNIVHGNALRLDWTEVVKPEELSYILGNPPFVGHQWRNAEQILDMSRTWGLDGRFGRLDYVACWYRKAVEFISCNPAIKVAFVSTNSISQGEQVGILWSYLLSRKVVINFAHRTFQWSSEASGKAAVHCVIVGFALQDEPKKLLFEYENIKSDPDVTVVNNINPYLVGGPDVLLPSRGVPLPGILQMNKGSQPTDGGHLILDDDARKELLAIEPDAEKWLRPYIGGDELISGVARWCLWLKNASPAELKKLPNVLKRISLVREARLKSPTKSVRDFADYPFLFTQDRQPEKHYLALPEVSSENRRFIPMAFLPPTVIASNKLQIIVGATNLHFGVLNSTMHMAWVRAVSGRLKSDYSYSPAVYNNFPWPDPTDKQREAIEQAAQGVLDARAKFPGSSLADLYDPLTMPPELTKAHAVLDRAVDAAYRKAGFKSEAERVAFLFERYVELSGLLSFEKPPKTGRKKKQ